MKYTITDVAEPSKNYIKEGEVTRKEFATLLMNELDAHVESEEEPFTVEVNGVLFTVEPDEEEDDRSELPWDYGKHFD